MTARCPRCGSGYLYPDDDKLGGRSLACVVCGEIQWEHPGTREPHREGWHPHMRLPVWKDDEP